VFAGFFLAFLAGCFPLSPHEVGMKPDTDCQAAVRSNSQNFFFSETEGVKSRKVAAHFL